MKNSKTLMLVIGCTILILFSSGHASQRVVVAEDFTGTWCVYCPAAANGLDQLYNEVGDSLIVLAYHVGTDPFQTVETYNRYDWYGNLIPGFPTVLFDGYEAVVGSTGGGADYTNYEMYRPVFDMHKIVSSPYEITIGLLNYDTLTRVGSVQLKIKNTGTLLEAGTLQFVVIERAIPYSWKGMTMVDFVVRDMIPDENGEAISLAAGDSVVKTRDFIIDPSWQYGKCQYVAFIQRDDKEIVQGSHLYGACLIQESYTIVEQGNNNGFYEPGETLDLSLNVKNLDAYGTDAVVEISTPDTFIIINNNLWAIGAMNANDTLDNAANPFVIQVKPTANILEGHPVEIVVAKKIYSSLYNGIVAIYDTVEFLVGSPNVINYDDFESGFANWTAGGTGGGSDWDTTTIDYHSADICVTDSKTGDYANSSSRYIEMVSSINLSSITGAKLSWYEKYNVLVGDYCQLQVSMDGGKNWLTASQYNGVVSSWQRKEFSLTNYDTCTDFHVRYTLTTDTKDVADGWYIDDVMVMGYITTGVCGKPDESAATTICTLKNAYPNPASGDVNISYNLSTEGLVRVGVYDIMGRMVKTLVNCRQLPGQYNMTWDGRNDTGAKVANGVYFYKLDTKGFTSTKKLTILK